MKKVIIGTLLGLSSFSILASEGYFTGEMLLGKTTQEVEGDNGDEISFGVRGAYNLNQNVAFELSYQSYGEADWTYTDGFGDTINEKTDTDSINIAVKGSLPFENGFSLHARVGLAFWNLDIDITDSSAPGVVFEGSDSGNDFYYGIGVQYFINDKFTVGLEYTVSEFKAKPNGDLKGISANLDVDTLALSAGLKF